MQLIRFLAIGTVLPAGTGRTQVAETFAIGQAIVFAGKSGRATSLAGTWGRSI